MSDWRYIARRWLRGEVGRIVADPGVCGGKPRIAGTRIVTECVQALVRAGYTHRQIAGLYPGLTERDVRAARRHAE